MTQDAPAPTKPKAFSYLRFSTPEQSKGDSRRRQIEAAERYAEGNGLEIDRELTFHDLGVSAFRGVNADTGRLGDFLRAVDDGLVPPGSYLLVESLDRISRSTARRALRVLEDIIERGVTVVTLSDRRVYDAQSLDKDPTSLIMSVLVFMRAHEESAMKSVRLRSVYNHKREVARSGGDTKKPFTRRLPAWITFNEDTQRLELIDERAEVVKEIFEMEAAGFGKDAIARRLNDRKEPPFGKAAFWRKSYVGKILANPACGGTFTPKTRELIDGKLTRVPQDPIHNYFPSVVDPERLTAKTAHDGPLRPPFSKSPASVFSGIATCGLCGGSFIKISKGKYRYLICSAAHARGGCEYLSVPYHVAESTILRSLKTIAEGVPRGENTKQLEADIVTGEIELSEIQDGLSFLAADYQATRSPTIRDRIEKLEAEGRAVAQGLAEKQRLREELSSGVIRKRIERLERIDVQAPLDTHEVNTALRETVKALIFQPKHGCVDVQWHNGGFLAESLPLRTRHMVSPFESEL